MRGLALVALGLLLAAPLAGAADVLRPFGGPVLVAQAATGADGVTLEFRYAFYLSEPAAVYLQNNPAPYNAAYRPGWSTVTAMLDSSGERSLGALVDDHPVELGLLQANRTYGLILKTHVPAGDLEVATQWNLTYVLAVHASPCMNCTSSGAALDSSVPIYITLAVADGAPAQQLEAFDLPPVPFTSAAQQQAERDWKDLPPGAGKLALLVAAAALVVLLIRRRSGAA